MRRLPELDEGSLITILSKVSDARDLARFSMVCSRWRSLCCSVSRLNLTFTVKNRQQMLSAEHTIASILRRAYTKSPACLKHLHVKLFCDYSHAEATGYWLPWAIDSLTSLSLVIDSIHSGEAIACWGPAVWSCLISAPPSKLECLKIRGYFDGLPATGWTFPNLKRCEILDSEALSVNLLQEMIAACPALESLHVSNFGLVPSQVLHVSSTSLEVLELLESTSGGRFDLILVNAPRLTTLAVSGCGCMSNVRLMNPVKKLAKLKLDDYCTLDEDADLSSVSWLMLVGYWEVPDRLFKRMPGITDLELDSGTCITSALLAPLLSLKRLRIQSDTLHYLDPDLELERITVHFLANWLEVLNVGCLLASGRIRRLVLEYVELCSSSAYKHNQIEALLAMQRRYPEQLSLKAVDSL